MKKTLTFERVLLWNPAQRETKVVFHVFDTRHPEVLIHRTTSSAEAEKMTGKKYDPRNLVVR